MRLNAIPTVEVIDHVVSAEGIHGRTLMPPGAVKSFLLSLPETSEWARRRLTGEFHPLREQVVTVRKRGHGVRPVAELFLRDQLLYRAIVHTWANFLPRPSTEQGSFEDFERSPLRDESATYVVSTDITAFYQYVDYDILGAELLKRTGDDDRITDLVKLLSGLTGRGFGLPQQNGVSDVLAETYIALMHRRLQRHGLLVARYNDDFRVTANSWSQALSAVDLLEHEARTLGLSLNDAKTVIRKKNLYEQDLTAHDALLKEISEQVELDLTDVIPGYGGDLLVEPEQEEVERGKWPAVLEQWLACSPSDDRPRYNVLTQLVPAALSRLSSECNAEISEVCHRALRREQSLTPAIARWMLTLPDTQHPDLLTIFDRLLEADAYITPWQTAWLAPMLSRVQTFAAGEAGSQRAAWLRETWDSRQTPEPVLAAVAQTLARHRIVNVEEILRAIEHTAETNHADLAAALGTALGENEHPGATALAEEDYCLRKAFELGALLG